MDGGDKSYEAVYTGTQRGRKEYKNTPIVSMGGMGTGHRGH